MNPVVSASQIKSFRLCVRKWAFEKIVGLRGPETASQTLGKEVDDNGLQPWLKHGKPIDASTEAGQIASTALKFLPPPKSHNLAVQKELKLHTPSGQGFGYTGYLDLWLPNGGMPGIDDDLPVVADFKTTKSIKSWALTNEQLATDVQAQIYATWAMYETRKPKVHLAWIYMQTKDTRKAERRWITVDGSHVATQFKAIDATAQELVQIRRKAPSEGDEAAKEYALSLEPNPDACGAFGGCPFRHECNLSPAQIIQSITSSIPTKRATEMANATVDLFANLEKKKKKQATTETPSVMGMSDRDVPAPPEDKIPEAFVGINPPEKELPLAPPVGSVEAKPEKAKRGRPKKEEVEPKVEKSGAELVAEMQANANPKKQVESEKAEKITETAFKEAWEDLGAAVKRFLKATGAM